MKIYDAHPESPKGISSIIEIHSRSPLLRGPNDDGSFRLIATASEGAPQFRLWRLNTAQKELMPYLKIETTFTDGIYYLQETHENQLVAANEHSIKFYDFVDKNDREHVQKNSKSKEELQQNIKKLFQELDKGNTGKLNKECIQLYIKNLSAKVGTQEFKWAEKVSEEAFDEVWYDFGCEESGNMSWHSVKPFIAKIIEKEA